MYREGETDADERLGLRGHPEDRVGLHRRAGLDVAPAERVEQGDPAAPRYEEHTAGEASLLHVPIEDRLEVREPLGRESHGRGLRALERRGVDGRRYGCQEGEKDRDDCDSQLRHEYLDSK